MGFFSFNEKYYLQKLDEFEGAKLNFASLVEAKRLLKVIDDLDDEGYFELGKYLEDKHNVVTRLKALIKANGETPFPVQSLAKAPVFDNKKIEAESYFAYLYSKKSSERQNIKAVEELKSYSEHIGFSSDVAYVFLLRDAFLPYLYFKDKFDAHCYPILVGRAFLNDFGKGVDDAFRVHIYDALEMGCACYDDFFAYVTNHMSRTFVNFTPLKNSLKSMLDDIPQEKILVVESGYMGTIPLMFASIDKRVDFTLYTTAPFLSDIYKKKIYCQNYENLRLLETLASQSRLFKFSSYSNGKFYITPSPDPSVLSRSLLEISSMLG